MPLSLLLAFLAPAYAGEPVLVPDFTPGTTSEFALAFMLQERVVQGLTGAGHVVLGAEAIEPVVGALDACADVEGCPIPALQQLPARVAVVVRVERKDGATSAQVEIFEESGPTPVDSRAVTVVSGKEAAFTDVVVQMVNDAFRDLGPGPATDLVAAAKLVANAEAKATAPKPEPQPEPEPASGTTPAAAGPEGDFEKRLGDAGLLPKHVAGAKAAFLETSKAPLEWFEEMVPHAGRLVVEVRAGMGIGDVDRVADVRLALDADAVELAEWYQESPAYNRRVRGAIYAGYAPATWVDLGAVIGLQYGERTLSTAFTQEGDDGAPPRSDSVQAVQGFVQPVARFYVAPLGIAKPYLAVGGDVRFFDRWKITDPPGVDYPTIPGGVVPGVVGGGGLVIDPGPIVGFFGDVGYTRHFGVRSAAAQKGDRPDDAPAPPGVRHWTLGVTGGVQFRL
jgi:hypothetical protein